MHNLVKFLLFFVVLSYCGWSILAQSNSSSNTSSPINGTTPSSSGTTKSNSNDTTQSSSGTTKSNSNDTTQSSSGTTNSNSNDTTQSSSGTTNSNSNNTTQSNSGTTNSNSNDTTQSSSGTTAQNNSTQSSNGSVTSSNPTDSNSNVTTTTGSSGSGSTNRYCYEDTKHTSNACNFASSISGAIAEVINRRCRTQLLSNESILSTSNGLIVDGSLCGVLNATTEKSANTSSLCFNSVDLTFHFVELSLPNNINSDTFKALALTAFNTKMMKVKGFNDLGFINWNAGSNGIEVSMIARFHGNESMNGSIYGNLDYSATVKNFFNLYHCSNPPTTTRPDVDISAAKSTSKMSCTFTSKRSSTEILKIINAKCREVYSYKINSFMGNRKITITNQRCGLKEASTVYEAGNSSVCFSYYDNQIKTNAIHRLRILELLYIPDFALIKKKAFRRVKNSIETSYNEMALSSPRILGMGFERAILLAIENPTFANKPSRKKRSFDLGTEAVIAVQFSEDTVDTQKYQENFNRETKKGTSLGEYKLYSAQNQFESVKSCNKTFKTLLRGLDSEILKSSGIYDMNLRAVIQMGSTLDLVCPPGKKFSKDDDGYVKNDGVYQLVCTAQLRMKVPLRSWPKCVPICPLKLPEAPSHTGLTSVTLEFTIPAGENGKYVCSKSDLGVDRGDSPFYEVECLNNSLYKLPIHKYDWPVCEDKTTTVRPEIPIGVHNMLARYTWNINYHYMQYQSDYDYIMKELKDYFSSITIPCFVGILILILLCLCVTRNDSPLCNICKDSTLRKKKTLIPYKESN